MDLPERVEKELIALAQKYQVKKLVLFGSRARGDNRPKSDIDLAVWGCRDFTNFALDVDETTWTLLQYDIINMDRKELSSELRSEIKRDGVVLYQAADSVL